MFTPRRLATNFALVLLAAPVVAVLAVAYSVVNGVAVIFYYTSYALARVGRLPDSSAEAILWALREFNGALKDAAGEEKP